jgi:aspartyl-tRNA synthetase
MTGEQSLPERPAEAVDAADAAEGGEKLSKKALKKLEKEKEKVTTLVDTLRKQPLTSVQAAKKQQLAEQEAARKAEAEASDISKGQYGETAIVGSKDYKPLSRKRHQMHQLADVPDGEEIAVRCRVTNARSQSAKLAFLNLRDRFDSIQAVVAASDTLSRQFVKFAAGVPGESIVDVVGIIKEPKEAIKSATIGNRELHITQLWVVSKSVPQLPIQIDDAEQAIPSDATAAEEQKSEGGRPLVGLATRLDNRVLDLRATLNKSIFEIRDGVHQLFEEFLRKQDPPFIKIDTPKLLGAPSEGGSNVFTVKYFDRNAYLAQSPQLYKQMLIAAEYKRVFETAPVFRAENSNTSRHLTEYTSLDLEMEFENDYSEVMYFIRDLLLYILNGLQTRYQTQTERVRKEYHAEPFKIPSTPEKVPILNFADGVKLLGEAGVHISEEEDIK